MGSAARTQAAQPSDSVVEADLVKEALSYATYGSQGMVAQQIATNAVRVTIKALAAQPRDDVEADLAACDRAIERMGWPEIKAFMAEPGQSPHEDAGGYLLRKIKTLFGIKPDRLETYREAAERLVAEARAQGGGSHRNDTALAPTTQGTDSEVEAACNMALRSQVFAALREHEVSDECFAAVASITHAALAAQPRDEAMVLSYKWAHEDAVSMGYPSLTEALEHLAELKGQPDTQGMDSGTDRKAVLEEAAQVAESETLPCSLGGDLILDAFTAETIAQAIRARAADKLVRN